MTVEYQNRSRGANDNFLLGMATGWISKTLRRRRQQPMSPGHKTRRAVRFSEVIEHPDRSHNVVRLALRSSRPISVQSLLTVTGQRIASMQLTQSKRASENVMRRGEHARMRVHRVEGFLVYEVIDVPRSAFLHHRLVIVSRGAAFERGPQPRKPRRIDDARHHDVTIVIERLSFAL